MLSKYVFTEQQNIAMFCMKAKVNSGGTKVLLGPVNCIWLLFLRSTELALSHVSALTMTICQILLISSEFVAGVMVK